MTEDINQRLSAIGALSIEDQMKPPLGKYSYNVYVKTIDDLLWYVECNAKEALTLKNNIVLDHDGNPNNVPDDHELYDYIVGRASAYNDVYIHLKKIMSDKEKTNEL